MDKPTILLQLDTDAMPSVFDRVVAVDSGVQHVFSYGGVTPDNVAALVHGCIFTRGPKDLHRTAIFVGGSDAEAGEALLRAVRKLLLPAYGLSVSVMLDSNGANTTAVAAVRAAAKHLDLSTVNALVLGGTGPVGRRVARLLAKRGGRVSIGSRQLDRAEAVAQAIRADHPGASVTAVATASSADAPQALEGKQLVVAAGAPGATLLPRKLRAGAKELRVVIDLNGVPPAGVEGVEPTDAGADREGHVAYGALGVGGAKMKLHKAAVAALFAAKDLVIDLDAIDGLS
jgi:hypothetical protein